MNDSKELLQKIAALRIRLDQAQALVPNGHAKAEALANAGAEAARALEDKVEGGRWHNALLDSALRSVEPGEKPKLPARLTQRAARLVQRSRDLLQELRALADDPILTQDQSDPLGELHAISTSMIDAVLRAVQGLPPSPTVQARLAHGLEAMLDVVEERLAVIKAGMRQRSVELSRVERLAEALRHIAAGQTVNVLALEQLADELREETRHGAPLRLRALAGEDPARAAATHGLNVAHVLARLLYGDPEWQGRDREALVAALVHDVGMLRLPPELASQKEPLTEEQRRLVERHPLAGAQALVKIWPGGSWAIDAAADHHERSDGTGYPKGKRDLHLADEVKLLTVCDVYAALAASRPWRLSQEPRTALTETLLLADRGALDKKAGERLLRLAFYPVGSVVELDDGSVALVVAPQAGELAIAHPARPKITVLREAFGQAPAAPRYLDLAAQRERSIVRGLSAAERRQVIGRHYPELV